ncbi:MAG: hypothetical protein AB1485_02480 [Candidatus Thermoplasmatota archaeon]
MAKIVIRKSIDELKSAVESAYPGRTVDKGSKLIVCKSNWVSTKLKFKAAGSETIIKIGSDMPPRAAVLLIIGILIAFLPALIGWLIYECVARNFAKEAIDRIQFIQ